MKICSKNNIHTLNYRIHFFQFTRQFLTLTMSYVIPSVNFRSPFMVHNMMNNCIDISNNGERVAHKSISNGLSSSFQSDEWRRIALRNICSRKEITSITLYLGIFTFMPISVNLCRSSVFSWEYLCFNFEWCKYAKCIE